MGSDLSFSQHGEDKFIEWFFRTQSPQARGTFIDVGAADGKTFSNTHLLALKGWCGTCVEPSPFVFPALATLYKHNAGVLLINAGIASSSELKVWHDSGGDMVSTFDDAHRELWSDKVPYQTFLLMAMTWGQLVEAHASRFSTPVVDFVNIDVEGSNAQVFATMPLDLVRPKLICVEDEPTKPDIGARMIGYAKAFGYHYVHNENVNMFFARQPLSCEYKPAE